MPEKKYGKFRRKKVGVIYGGFSAERDISRVTGRAVINALRRKGYRVVPISAKRNLPMVLRVRRVEVVFNALHGTMGEDGCTQGMLEVLAIPYTGSGVLASALSMDKVLAKEIFLRKGIPTPPHRVVDRSQRTRRIPVSLPLVVKPRAEGSTIGVSIVRRQKDLPRALAKAFRFDGTCLVEKYIPGKEIAVGVLNGKALGAVEIRPRRGFYDFKAKYTPGMARHIYPAPVKRKVYRRILEIAEKACAALGCEGAPRVDIRLTRRGRIYVLEVNTLPGMTPLSLLPEIAEGEGIPFSDLVERILNGARLKTQARI